MNKKGFAISGIIYSLLILFLLLLFGFLSIMGARKMILDKLKNEVMEELNGNESEYIDNSGANKPELLDNMLPIKYENDNWVLANLTQKWYDYDTKEWANAVVLKNDMIKDMSENHNDIKITNKYTNQSGMAYFDGVDDYLDLGYKQYDFENTASMVLRFKFHSFDNTRESVMFGNCEGSGIYFRITREGKLEFVLYNENLNKYVVNTGPTVEIEKWYTIVGTYDGSNINFYINGELYSSVSSIGEIKPSPVQIILGANPQSNNTVIGFTNFTVSDAMVYDRVITEKEVINSFSNEISTYDKSNLLFGYNYFGSTQDYYKEKYNKGGKTIVNESDIDLWYVWIPRYKYQLFNANNGSVSEQEIKIQFESGTATTGTVNCTDNISGIDGTTSSEICTNASNGNWYTHPAFTFGNKELTGFWVGKFEVSGSTSKITIKPNVTSLRSQTVSSFFTAIQNINTTYNLNGDSHMMKNMEWGAVAYLSHSKYGTCTDGTCVEVGINNNSNYITGCGAVAGSSSSGSCNAYNTTTGMLASTTGNIYGVYDMSGGTWEYVMGNMVNSSGAFYSSSAGFSTPPDSIYYDSYTYGTSYTTHGRGKLGDATKETLKTFGSVFGGWYSDYADFPYSSLSWFSRGGIYDSGSTAGLFLFSRGVGNALSYASARAVVCVRG